MERKRVAFTFGTGLWIMAAAPACLLIAPGPVHAGAPSAACILFVGSNPSEANNPYLFPNWQQAQLVRYDLTMCDILEDDACSTLTSEVIEGLTIQNFGTATEADITGMYWRIECSTVDSGLLTMDYVGIWNGHPTWTWTGPSLELVECEVNVQLRVYADISACPTDGATVITTIPYDEIFGGGILDNNGCTGLFGNAMDPLPKVIRHIVKKVDRTVVAPADTVQYTLWYGKAGTGTLDGIVITDTIPTYMHWNGVSSVPPDPGWNPDPGPPPRLRWTIPGPIDPGPGRTAEITFQATVDWGNMDNFEDGSGDIAAPEGDRIQNQAHIYFDNSTCATDAFSSNPTSTVIRRYLFWKLGSNDILYAGKVGIPDDEVVFSIFAKNESATKTWWNVSVWDTVPDELDVWGIDCGLDDPFLGWTMTPTGAGGANPGRIITGTTTILTWMLDLPPGATIELKWKAKVRPTAEAETSAVGIASLMALGRPGTLGGTGHALKPRQFAHVAPIVLRTVYVSYLGIGGGGLGNDGVSLVFFPLHQGANFELRGIEYENPTSPYPVEGGVSESIGAYIGTCLTGMWCPASNGCGLERAPAHYSKWTDACWPDGDAGPERPFHLLYKLTANSPVLWMMFSALRSDSHDCHTFTPSTGLSFSGFIHYTFLRENAELDQGDALNIMNTSIDANEVFDPELGTTVYVFRWDGASSSYRLFSYHEIDKESQYVLPPLHSTAEEGFYRVLSSDAKVVCRQSALCFGIVRGGSYNNFSHLMPNAERGTLVSKPGDRIYIFPRGDTDPNCVIVGNTGNTKATYRIEKYIPFDLYDRPPTVPLWMAGTSGTWEFMRRHTVESGLAVGPSDGGNPHVYGTQYDNTVSFVTPDTTAAIFRIVHESGADEGGLEINSGSQVMAVYSGGSLVHAADGEQIGDDFWVFTARNWCMALSHCYLEVTGSIYSIDLFCPKPGMAVNCEASDNPGGVTHVTTGPDQCVAFMGLTDVTDGEKRNYHITLADGSTEGNMIAMYNHCQPSHKFFTAPFMATGVHYEIIAPPFAFVGQDFWITVLVLESAGGTKLDYCGTTAFTSTDPGTVIETVPMALFTYDWDSDDPLATCLPAGCIAGCDNGIKVFINVSMSELGQQTIIASDILDGSVTGLTTVMVVGANVVLTKEPPMRVSSSGEIVQFKICWSNYSSASVEEFTLTDRIPNGTTYSPDAEINHFCGCTGCSDEQPFVLGSSVAFSTAGGAATDFEEMGDAGPQTEAVTWLRWIIPIVGVNTTGCVCFEVTIN